MLVHCPELYDRPGLYGVGNNDYPDNAVRFALLARAALEFGCARRRAAGRRPRARLAGRAGPRLPALGVLRGRPGLGAAATVFTIHNLAYQGVFPPSTMPALDLGWELYGIEGLEFWGRVSFLKAGINFSEIVTTVSPRYAREIQTAEFGFGFEGILARRSDRVVGILNGIDTDVWNPASDPSPPEAVRAGHARREARVEARPARDAWACR